LPQLPVFVDVLELTGRFSLPPLQIPLSY